MISFGWFLAAVLLGDVLVQGQPRLAPWIAAPVAALLYAAPRWLARPALAGADPSLSESQRAWLALLAQWAGLPRLALRGSAELNEPALISGRTLLLGPEALDREQPWRLLTTAAQAMAEATISRWTPALAGGVGLGLGLALGWGGPWAALLVLGTVLLAAQVQVAGAQRRDERVRRRAADLIGRLRTEQPEAFAELARAQGLEG